MDVDPELVRAVQRGEPGAMEALILATYEAVHAMCLRLLRDQADAADATQEVFLRVTRSVVGFRGDAQFGTWLHRITANVCATSLRRRGDTRARGQGAGFQAFAAPDSILDLEAIDDTEGRVVELEETSDVVRAMADLSDDEREVVVLRDIEGLSTRQAAELLGITESATKVRLHRAHAKLRSAVVR